MSDAAQALATQNAARQDANNNHGSNCAPLNWDSNLASAAQAWAEAMAKSQNFDHSDPNSRENQGENLYLYAGTNAVAEFNGAAAAWCGEIANYHGEPIGEGNFEGYGHYTQVVWPTSTAVGMGIAQDSNGAFYVCGRYSPTGNISGVSAWGVNQGPNPGPPSAGHTDGVYLMNVVNGDQQKSGFAWYANMGNNDGKYPQAWLDLTETGFYQWEGNPFSGTPLFTYSEFNNLG
ncbi:CAP domain-containing protein [Cadophora sp. MPI-SDFR-AT-0126]|nr:CAP domain-containing protein [Leotiomycetes sp. MPI-SDFR-AT-0126]